MGVHIVGADGDGVVPDLSPDEVLLAKLPTRMSPQRQLIALRHQPPRRAVQTGRIEGITWPTPPYTAYPFYAGLLSALRSVR